MPSRGSSPKQRIFFIVGRGRSGTTLLSRMLARHPRLEVAPEGFFVMNLWRRHGRALLTADRVDDFCRDLLAENRMRTWGLDLADVGRRLREPPPPAYADACERVYASYAHSTRGRPGVELVGDKNPHYGLFTEHLIRLFPDARFIHVVRDPRDNVLSYRSVPFDLQDSAALAYRWRRYNEEILAVASRHPDNFHQLRFEDLVAHPEPSLTEVCNALGVDYDPALLEFHTEQPDGFYGKHSHWFDKLGAPLDGRQADKWRTGLAPEDIVATEAICAPLMARFEYATSIPVPDTSLLTARAHLGALAGRASVGAEKLVFGAVPAEARTWFINTYRARTGRT